MKNIKDKKKAKKAAAAEATKVATTEVAEDKDAKIVAALEKAKDKKVKKDKKDKTPRVTIDSVTMDLLKKPGGMSLSSIVKELAKQFPKHNVDTLKATTKRRVCGYLKNKHGVVIKKDDNGKYSIAA